MEVLVQPFLQRWGGEILYDNYKVIVNHRIGQDRGVEIRYGKNMEEIEQQIDYTKRGNTYSPGCL